LGVNSIKQYEKIGNFAYKLDVNTNRIFMIAIFLLLLLVSYLFIIFIGEPKTTQDFWFYENILSWLIPGLLYSSSFFLIITVILQWIGFGYKKFKKWNVREIIKLYFYELSKNPVDDRKWEIIKHLSFNLQKLEMIERKNVGSLRNRDWRIYNRINRSYLRFRVNIINRIINLIEDAVIFLDDNLYSQLFCEIGDYIEKNDYKKISNIMLDNTKIFQTIEEIKDDSYNGSKDRLLKARKRIEWVSIHGRNLTWILLIILLLYLYFSGSLPSFPML